MAYKVFTNGSVLNASEVNDNLMNQAVITFTNSTARASAITSPVEGMVTYLADTDTYQFWNGSAWTNLVSSTVGTGNAIINGAFEINQRNFTSSTTNNVYPFDRWVTVLAGDGTSTFSSQVFTPGAAPFAGYEASNFLRVVTTGQTSAAVRTSFTQRIEDVRTFAGQTVTLSFFARSGSSTPKLALELFQEFGSGGSAILNITSQQVTLSTSWTRYSLTFAVPSISGKTIGTASFLGLNVFASAGSDLNSRTGSLGIQTNTFDIWGVQLEAGSSATPFRRNANSLQGELAACQRYFVRIDSGSPSGARGIYGSGVVRSSTAVITFLPYPVPMRALASISASGAIRALSGGSSSATYAGGASNLFGAQPDWTVSGLTTGQGVIIQGDDALNSSLSISAEL